MRVVIVSPYPWDRPSLPTEHVRALAGALARRGVEVVVLASSHSPARLREGRALLRSLARGERAALTPHPGVPLVVAVGYAVELRPGAQSLPVSVAARAWIAIALAGGRMDVVELIDADLLGPVSTAIRRSSAPIVATFTRPPVLAWSRLRSRVGATRALTAETASALGGVPTSGIAVDPAFARGPEAEPPLVVLDAGLSDAPMLRALAGELASSGAAVALLGTKPLRVAQLVATGETARSVRVVRQADSPVERAALLAGASLLVAGEGGSLLAGAEALASGVPVVATAGAPASALVTHGDTGYVAAGDQPALVAAFAGRLLAEREERAAMSARATATAPRADRVGRDSVALYSSLVDDQRPPRPATSVRPILCDFHMHTSHSPDSATSPAELVETAVAIGLGAIAVTDHDSIAGGLEARAVAAEHGLPLHVVVGSEVKTATGEVIGLYLTEDVPGGQPFIDTVAAIRAQGAVVYVPHPFDRRHAIPDPDLLARLVDELDVIEVANGRLLRESYNDDALAFAERHALLQGAGSDEHVIEGLGSAVVELPPFRDPESLLEALAHGRILRRPTSFYRLQALKLARQARRRLRSR